MKTADRLGLPRRTKRPYLPPAVVTAPMPPAPFKRAQLFDALALPGGAGSAVARAFEMMGICEEELERTKLDALSRTTNLFLMLMPPPSMNEVSTAVYRAHCQELLRRVKQSTGEPLRLDLPTKAEILMALSAESFKHPLDPTLTRIMGQCFARVFPEKAAQVLPHDAIAQPLQPVEQEVLDGLMVKLRVKDRKLETR